MPSVARCVIAAAVPSSFGNGLWYAIPAALETLVSRGAVVRVPYGKKTVWAIVWSVGSRDAVLPPSIRVEKLKSIETTSRHRVSEAQLGMVDALQLQSLQPLSAFATLLLPTFVQKHLEDMDAPAVIAAPKHPSPSAKPTTIWWEEPYAAKDAIFERLRALEDVTLLLFPTEADVKAWKDLGPTLHGKTTPKRRQLVWDAARSATAGIYVGTGPLLFYPWAGADRIVVAREDDRQYPFDQRPPCYDPRDAATMLARAMRAEHIVLSPAPRMSTVVQTITTTDDITERA